MRKSDLGRWVRVSISADEVRAFKRSWPCSGLPSVAIWFEFDKKNGDLVDMKRTRALEAADGPALLALSQDAQEYAGL